MKHMERIWPGFVVFVYVSCRIVVCNVEVYFRLYETELYKPHYKSTNYTYKWHVKCFMKKATGGALPAGTIGPVDGLADRAAVTEHSSYSAHVVT